MPRKFQQSPGNVEIKIYADTKFNEKNSKIWAFGYKGGDINFSNGSIIMKSNGRLGSSSYMTTLIKFENRIFNTTNKVNRTFNDIYNEAMSTVSNKEKNDKTMIMVILLPIIMYLAMFIIIIEIVKRYVSKKPLKTLQFDGGTMLPNQKEVDYFRDIPCNKDLFRAYWIIYKYGIVSNSKAKSYLIGAILLKWIKEGKINISKTKKGLFSFKDNNYAIDLTNINSVDNELENSLLRHLKEASGKNLILEAKEFEKWCKKNYTILDLWFDRVINLKTEQLVKEGLIKEDTIIKKQLGVQITKKIQTVDSSIKGEAIQILGLKKFLLEYSMIQDRQVIEVHLWEEYLIYATLLGIADKVQEQFSKLYPEFKELSNLNTEDIIIYTNQFAYIGVDAARKAREEYYERRSSYSSGGGGSSYSGGGSSASGSSSGGGFR
ncbi:MAG: DUF2207 domain-containing protein [Clostridia bacterium]|nr:DUF2207 domain-containing protein [Clostridia bacterium]